MKIITVINDPAVLGFNLLRISCAFNDHELIVLVHSQKNFFSNRIKDNMLKEYLQKIDYDELVFFTDGFDTFLMAREDEILEKYHRMNKEVIFSAETTCWPDASLARQYPGSGTAYRFLNSGGFIGKAGIISELLEDELFDTDNFKRSNQYIWVKRFFKYPEKIGLDTGCSLFCTFSPEVGNDHLPKGNSPDHRAYSMHMKKWFESNFITREGRIFNKTTESWPCQAHFNGHSKILIDKDMIDLVFSMLPAKKAQFIYEKEKNFAKLLS